MAESHSNPETEFISNSEPSQLDDFFSSLGETLQLSELQHSISELPGHSANDTELHQIQVDKVVQRKPFKSSLTTRN